MPHDTAPPTSASRPTHRAARVRSLIALLVGLVLVALAAGPGQSSIAPLTPIASNPLGSQAASVAITDRLTQMIDQAPAGSTIRLANPRMSTRVAGALGRAATRGVSVRVVTDPGAETQGTVAGLKAVVANLGTDTTRSSYVRLCAKSCSKPSIAWSLMHAKTAAFSDVGGRPATIITSQDLYPRIDSFEWNNALVTSNAKVYSSIASWFDGIVRGNGRTFSAGIDAGDMNVYLFPRPQDTVSDNFFTRILAPIRCTNGTRVDVMTFDWRPNMRRVVDRLGALRLLGCRVRVVINSARTDPGILRALQRQKLSTRFSDHVRASDRKRFLSHAKLVSVSGYYGSSWVDTTFVGSANIALGSVQAFDDNFVRVKNNATVYNTYRSQVNGVWSAGRNIPVARASLSLTRVGTKVTARLTATGEGVTGSTVWLSRRVRPGVWKVAGQGRTDSDGRISWRQAKTGPLRAGFTGATNLTTARSRISWSARRG